MTPARHVITTLLLAAAAPACGFDPTLVVACDDGVMNGAEAGVDCGGGCPDACPTVTGCMAPADCESRVCVAGECLAASCEDGVKNGAEGDVDCGVICDWPCADHQGCATAGDCTSGVCAAGRCLPATCGDGTKNADESDVDCGGGCQSCDNGKACAMDADCASRACVGGSCSIWVKPVGPIDLGGAHAVDSAGNLFATGKFTGTVNFGGQTLDAAVGNLFLAKYAPTGMHLWSKSVYPGLVSGASAASFDTSGNALVAGYTDNGDFGGGTLPGPGLFVAKYSVAGDHVWSKLFNLTAGAAVSALTTASNDDVVLTGWFQTPTLTFGTTVLTNPISPGYIPYVAKLAADGSAVWAIAPSLIAQGGVGYAIAADGAGDVLVTGSFVSPLVDFGCGTQSSSGNATAFVAKLDGATGACAWSIVDEPPPFTVVGQDGAGVVVDPSGSVFVAGAYATANPDPTEVFVDKYAGADGSLVWSRPLITDAAPDVPFHMALDAVGDVVISGRYRGAAPDFGGGALVNAAPPTHDVFIAKYASADGAHLYSRRYGGAGEDFALGLGISPTTGGAVLMGLFQDSVDFGTGPLQAGSPCSAFFLGMGSLPGGAP